MRAPGSPSGRKQLSCVRSPRTTMGICTSNTVAPIKADKTTMKEDQDMNRLSFKMAKRVSAPAAAAAALLALSACGGSDQRTSNSAATDQNVAVPADENASAVAAEMHNQMSGEAENRTLGTSGGMADDQMGAMNASGSAANGQMGAMTHDDMPMDGNMSSGNMSDHHRMGGNMGGAKTMPKGPHKPMPKDKSMPMEDEM